MTRIPAFLKSYSDSSFTNPHQVALPETPPDCTGDFTHMGAKYWGFETKRHVATTINATNDGFNFNAEGHHWLHLGLAFRSKITSLSVSTKWFTGNQVPVISVLLTDKKNVQPPQLLQKNDSHPMPSISLILTRLGRLTAKCFVITKAVFLRSVCLVNRVTRYTNKKTYSNTLKFLIYPMNTTADLPMSWLENVSRIICLAGSQRELGLANTRYSSYNRKPILQPSLLTLTCTD